MFFHMFLLFKCWSLLQISSDNIILSEEAASWALTLHRGMRWKPTKIWNTFVSFHNPHLLDFIIASRQQGARYHLYYVSSCDGRLTKYWKEYNLEFKETHAGGIRKVHL